MKIKAEESEAWGPYQELQTDSYSRATLEYAIRWAEHMEAELEAQPDTETYDTLKEVLVSTSHVADVEGITGPMFFMAGGVLARFWVHGADLKRAYSAVRDGDK